MEWAEPHPGIRNVWLLCRAERVTTRTEISRVYEIMRQQNCCTALGWLCILSEIELELMTPCRRGVLCTNTKDKKNSCWADNITEEGFNFNRPQATKPLAESTPQATVEGCWVSQYFYIEESCVHWQQQELFLNPHQHCGLTIERESIRDVLKQ